MECYAKSATKSLSDNEKNEIIEKINSVIEEVQDKLTLSEKTAIDNSINEFINTTEKGQVTLKQHLEEIVICAENFFEIYGRYFTEKEKCLVIEACRIHDIEMNIHRTRRMYEFDMEKCMGRGLMKKEAQNSIFI